MTVNAFISRETNQYLQAICPVSDRLSSMRLAVKDLFDIQGLPTTAGNPSWQKSHAIPTQTSSVVTKLIANGADYVGKTITDEIAYSLNGQNMHYGTPTNPITPDRLPGGSSSGSAVAVSSGVADIGLGTDTGGSIRVPSSYNAIYGLRPTHGRISIDNAVPLAPSFDTVGWMCRDIDSLGKVSEVLFDEYCQPSENIKLAIADDLLCLAEHQNAIVEVISTIKHANNIHFEQRDLDVQKFDNGLTFQVLQGFEIWQQHSEWIQKTNPVFSDDIRRRLKWCQHITKSEALAASNVRIAFNDYLDTHIFQDIDCLLLPTTSGYAPLLSSTSQEMLDYRNRLMSLTSIAGLSGRPQIHIPLSNAPYPCGLSLIGHINQDMKLIGVAKTIMEHIPYAK